MADNTSSPAEVPITRNAPPLWLVSGDVRRRLSLRAGHMRTHVGLAAIIDQFVETIPIKEIKSLEVLAPYSPPSSKLGMILIGCAIGALVTGESGAMTGIVLAITIFAFALVTLMISRSVPSAQRIAKITTTSGRAYCIAYRYEDEDEVRRIIPHAGWSDKTDDLTIISLTPEEKHRANGMRISIVLSTSAFALIILYVFGRTNDNLPSTLGVPADIIVATAWCITVIVNLIAWGKMLIYRIAPDRSSANRRRP